MLTDRQCCVLETRKNRMVVLDLDTDKEFYLDHEFKTEEADQSFIDVFPDSQSVVIRENGRYNNNTFKLTYYHYPLTPDSKPYHVFQENDGAWTYEFMVRKANSHSMYCWFKGRHDDGFEFRTYDLRDDPAGKYQVHKFPQEVGKNDGMNKTEVAITTMWEMTPGVFMFVCISSRKDEANNNYVCDTKTGVIREAKFSFEQYQPLTIDQISFGNTCMFRTFDFENGKTLETPVYYISNETEEIVAQDTWYCSHLNKYTLVGYDSNMIVDSMFENGNVKEITMKATKVMQPKEITVHFLNEIIDDCDDDLLYEVSKVIDYSKKA